MHMSKLFLTAALAAGPLSACSSGESGRAAVKPAEIEITSTNAGATTIVRYEIEYAGGGSHIQEITRSTNGTVDGRFEWTYEGDQVARIDFTDADGDRTTTELDYEQDRLARRVLTMANETYTDQFEYDDARDGRLDEITSTWGDGNLLTVLDYDDAGRLEKMTITDGNDTLADELDYDAEGRIDRATTLFGTSLIELYDFAYDPEGRIEEIVGDGVRVSVSYDGQGRVEEVERFQDGDTVRFRYTYESGSVRGISFVPETPFGYFFDLRGASFAGFEPLHLSVSSLPLDAPSADAVPNGTTCGGYSPQDACEECTFDSCCSELLTCVDSNECLNYYECASTCTTSTCVEDCRYWYPTGAYQYDAFAGCAEAYCRTPCNL